MHGVPLARLWIPLCSGGPQRLTGTPLRMFHTPCKLAIVWTAEFVTDQFDGTHQVLNNATYSDAAKEIAFNQAWAKQVDFTAAPRWSANGLIPPAITGLHNGDVIKAWL